MSYLTFISDKDLFSCIGKLHETYINCQKEFTISQFYKNKVDPIKFLFDMSFNEIEESIYIKNEIARQVDKTITNAIGNFHQDLLGCVKGMNNLRVGNGCDLVNDDKTIFAEVKNKHNTMNSSSAEATFQKLIKTADENPKATCYLVEVIAKKSVNELWEGTYNNTKYSHPRVRKISADEFYYLVTGDENAFFNLCKILPKAISEYLKEKKKGNNKSVSTDSVYSKLMDKAEKNDRTFIEQVMYDNFDTYKGF